MGAVFYVLGILIPLICLSAFLLLIAIALMIWKIISSVRKKKVKGLTLTMTIFFVLTGVASVIPVTSIVIFKANYEREYPTIGRIIDQKVYQEEEFTVQGEKYQRYNIVRPNFLLGDCKRAFTYQEEVFGFLANSGYYWEYEIPNTGLSVYITERGNDLFVKESDATAFTNYLLGSDYSYEIDFKDAPASLTSSISAVLRLNYSMYSVVYFTSEPTTNVTVEQLTEDKSFVYQEMTFYYHDENYYRFEESGFNSNYNAYVYKSTLIDEEDTSDLSTLFDYVAQS